jgi:regulator of replication initiation timing
LQDEKKMRETAESRMSELEAAHDRTERQLNDLRAAFADLYLENQMLRNESRTLQTQAAQLVLNKKPAGADEAADLDRRLALTLQHAQKAEQQLQELKTHLQTVLDIENISDAVKNLTNARIDSVFQELNRMDEYGNPIAPPEGGVTRQASVLAVHPELQLIVLDKGTQHGVTAGSTWIIENSQKRPIAAQIISVRPRISAAIIQSGSLNDAVPGQNARRQISEPTRN